MSIRDICVQSNLYTIPNEDIDKKFILENYYANNVDSAFPDIYNILIDDKIVHISPNQKNKILFTVLSLYFRTPKFLNSISSNDDKIIEASAITKDQQGYVRINWEDGQKSFFHIDKLNEEKSRRREYNRIKFLREHFEAWHDFVFKRNHGVINVFKFQETKPLITSNNPVQIGSLYGGDGLFSSYGSIRLPLDSHHLLWIAPYEINHDKSQLNRIYRQYRDESFAITSNKKAEQLAERRIFGSPGSISHHISDQQKFNTIEFGEPLIENFKDKISALNELLSLMKRHGVSNSIVADKVKQMRRLNAFKDSRELQFIIDSLAKNGFLTV